MMQVDVIDGVPCVRAGSGATRVVAIAGGDAFMRRFSAASAERGAARIARLFRDATVYVLGYDMRADGPRDAASIASQLADIIERHIGPSVLAGISFGGFVALRIAAERPELVRRLVLISTAHRFSAEGRQRTEQQIADVRRGDFVAMTRPFLTIYRRWWRSLLVRAMVRLSRGRLAEGMNEPEAIARMLETALEGTDPALLPRIEAPTLLVIGTRDQFFDLAAASDTVNAIAGARLVTFEGETHPLPLERWRDVRKALVSS